MPMRLGRLQRQSRRAFGASAVPEVSTSSARDPGPGGRAVGGVIEPVLFLCVRWQPNGPFEAFDFPQYWACSYIEYGLR